ncbi:MAG: HAMP domain-containing protein [Rubrivivax sp.]|nr:HAMP domain-containing protein [Rubrivivax sp.]
MQQWIRNLRLARKFTLIAALALALLAVPTVLIVNSEVATIAFARSMRSGIEPAEAALGVIQMTQQHRGLSAVLLGGNAATLARQQAKSAEVDALLGKLVPVATALDAKLGEQATRIGQDWTALTNAVSARSLDGPASFARHTALLASMLRLLDDIADLSGIALDPEGASYFLGQATLGSLPHLTEAMGQLRARGAGLLSRGEAKPEEKATLAGLIEIARLHYGKAAVAFEKSRRYDAALTGAVGEASASALRAAEELFKLVDQELVRADKLAYPPAQYVEEATKRIDAQFALIDGAFKALANELHGRVNRSQNTLAVTALAIALLGSLVAWVTWLVARGTVQSMAQAVQVARAVAEGDLGSRVQATARDEAGQLLNSLGEMNARLAGLVGQVRNDAQSVATASTQIAQGNQDLSHRTEQQASALQQTAATMEELSSTVRSNAANAREANALAQSASSVAQKGGNVVGQVVETMRGINESSRRIAEIIAVIDGIAFQTNILALNAAVEAARAGEQGRGFAVVASEVRSLAQRSAEAAREIKTLISTSVERVELGSTQVGEAGQTMQEIVAAIERVTAIVGEISSASAEQAQGVGQVGAAVTQMDQATQQNAALVEQSTAAAESLRHQSQRLVQAVAVFRLGGTPAAAG